MMRLGKEIAGLIRPPTCIYLIGQIGAGKTTFARGFIQSLGFAGPVKSPTFTLVETYLTDSCVINHFDLFRLDSVEELEHIGLDDYLNSRSILLIEWPEVGSNVLPLPDLKIQIDIKGDSRQISLSCKKHSVIAKDLAESENL